MKTSACSIRQVALALLSPALAASAPAAAVPLYTITQTVAVGSAGRWNYVAVDHFTHRVFVARSDQVTVIDGITGKIVGQIGTSSRSTRGVEVAAKFNRGYTDDGRNGVVEEFDLTTLQPAGSLPAEKDADGITFDDASHVFVVDGESGKITVIDASTNKVVNTINVGGSLEALGRDARGKIFVNDRSRNELVRIDTASGKIDARWPLAGCSGPTGMAVDHRNGLVFSACRNGVMTVMNGASGERLSTLPIGKHPDGVSFDPVRKRIFSANGRDGTITVVQELSPTSFAVTGTVTTQVSVSAMAIDTLTGRLFVAAATSDVASAGGVRRGTQTLPRSLKLLFLDPVS